MRFLESRIKNTTIAVFRDYNWYQFYIVFILPVLRSKYLSARYFYKFGTGIVIHGFTITFVIVYVRGLKIRIFYELSS